MKKIILIAALLLIIINVNAQTASDSTAIRFQKLVDDNNMLFTMPAGTSPIPLVKNVQVHYEYAVKFNDKPVEIRYSIFPLTERVAAYKKYQEEKTPGVTMVEPNTFSKGLTYAVATNVGGGVRDPNIGFNPFPAEHIKPEFGADFGGTWIIPIKNNSFGTDYKYCVMTSLHRNDVADAFIIYLGNSREDLFNMFKENPGVDGLFYALKFKQ